jgi:xylulokinase
VYKRQIHNLALHNTRADLIRAIMEGVAYNTRWLLGPVRKFLGRQVESLNLAGGGGRSDVWCQILADVLQVQVRQVRDAIQANARGAAWIGAVGLGEIGFGDVPALVEFRATYEPTPQNRVLYDDGFEAFLQIYKRMSPVYRRLNG